MSSYQAKKRKMQRYLHLMHPDIMHITMSSDQAKKSKIHGQQSEASPISEQGNIMTPDKMMAEMKAMMDQNSLQMALMQNEIDCMKERISRVDDLERKCVNLENICSSLGRSVKVLAKHWEYSAPHDPSHWVRRGFSYEYVENTVGIFLKGIADVIAELKRGNFYVDIREREDSLVIHDDLLLVHWESLADAMQLCNHFQGGDDYISFTIRNVELPPKVLDILSEGMEETTTITRFEFNRNFMAEGDSLRGMDFALELAQNNPNLQEFGWVNNSLANMNYANRLVEAINSHPSIEHVRLENCCPENVNGYTLLCSLLAGGKHFDSIHLKSNSIRTMGGTHLSNYLSTNPSLRYLKLEHNHLNDNDAISIAGSLAQNTNLQNLCLNWNDITEAGGDVLFNAIYNPTSLNSVSNCNHSCKVEVGGTTMAVQHANAQYANAQYMSHMNRANKIYSLLISRNREGTNVHHLDLELGDESLKLVPHVLECLHHYSGYRQELLRDARPLSIFYEILRSWNMPSLYESHGAIRAT